MNGALLVDKPAGVTSHDVVAIVRRALKEGGAPRPTVGHTGTLDPFATGLLVVLVGKATRLARFLDGFEKEYEAVVRLGVGSDTDDATGTLTLPSAISQQPAVAEVKQALAEFLGSQQQMPPAYSAKKIDGQRAYARARKGEEVVLKAVEVTIHSIELLQYAWPDVTIRARVSTGTYLRSLARDLGTRLGTVAHCAALRRTRIGRFEVSSACPLATIQESGPEHRIADSGRFSMLDLVSHLPQQALGDGEAAFVKNGRKVPTDRPTGPVALVHQGELLAVAEVAEGMAQPVVVLAE